MYKKWARNYKRPSSELVIQGHVWPLNVELVPPSVVGPSRSIEATEESQGQQDTSQIKSRHIIVKYRLLASMIIEKEFPGNYVGTS